MKEFPDNKLSAIFASLEQLAERHRGPKIAAFDADGTLWRNDLGEQFFDYQIHHCNLETLSDDPWKEYRDMKAHVNPETAYLWLAQINRGQKLETVRNWAQKCLEFNAPTPVFGFQQQIISKLQELKFDIYIVTASIAWAVEPGASLVGLTPEQVIGIRTSIENGVVTEHQEGVITYRQGKVKALLEKTKQHRPLFCSGNSEGDLALLESSVGICLALASAKPEELNYATEQRLQKIAAQRGWYSHSFI